MSKGATVNGLYAAHMPKGRKVNRVAPAGAEVKFVKESEMEAYKIVAHEETKMKDKLMEILSERCSTAEAKCEELGLEKARVERELEGTKLALQAKEHAEREVQTLKNTLTEREEAIVRERENANMKETQLLHLTKQLHQLREELRGAEGEIHQQNQSIQSLQSTVEIQRNDISRINAEYHSHLQELQQQEQVTEEVDNSHYEEERQQMLERINIIEDERDQLRAAVENLMQENDNIRRACSEAKSRLGNEAAQHENVKRRAESYSKEIKEKEQLVKTSEAEKLEAEGRASRISEQLKKSNKKATFLVRKADTIQARYDEKEAEVRSLKADLEDIQKKYAVAKERLQYMKHTNNNFVHKTNKHPGPGVSMIPKPGKRVEEPNHNRKSIPTAKQGNPKRIIDPALAEDSDAPAWMKF